MVDSEGTYTYTYDNSDELTNVDKNGTQVESYSYDLNGNRTGTGYSTTVMNETLTSPGVITYTYDKAGNMISANSGGTFTTYTYDYRNRLTEVTQGGTVIATYTYNALDQRIGVQEAGSRTWTVYNGTSRRCDALRRFQRFGHAADPLRVWSGHGQWGGCRRDPGPDELGWDNGVVSARQAGVGAGHRELVGIGAGPHRLRQLREHPDRDEREQR